MFVAAITRYNTAYENHREQRLDTLCW